jgi:hypothetical protein
MTDSLLNRAQLAIEESQQLHNRRRLLRSEVDRERDSLRLAVFEAAMYRSEIKAYRDNKD